MTTHSRRTDLSTAVATPNGAVARPLSLPYDVEQDGNLRGTVNTLLQHLPTMGIAFLVALLLGVAFLLLMPSVYRVDSLVQLDDRKTTSTFTGNPQNAAYQLPSSPLQGEIDILKSRELLQKAIVTTGADMDIEVANRMPLIGRAYARWRAQTLDGGVAPAPLGLTSFAWGGEQLRIATFEIPATQFDNDFTLVGNGAN